MDQHGEMRGSRRRWEGVVAASGTDKTGGAALLTWPRCGGARNVAIREG